MVIFDLSLNLMSLNPMFTVYRLGKYDTCVQGTLCASLIYVEITSV